MALSRYDRSGGVTVKVERCPFCGASIAEQNKIFSAHLRWRCGTVQEVFR